MTVDALARLLAPVGKPVPPRHPEPNAVVGPATTRGRPADGATGAPGDHPGPTVGDSPAGPA